MGLLSLALGLGLALGGASCILPNPDHCLHKAVDTNAWCAEAHPDRPWCSPCEATHNGCVAEEPSPESCPEYSASPPADTGTDSDSDSDSDSGTDTGTNSDSGTTSTG